MDLTVNSSTWLCVTRNTSISKSTCKMAAPMDLTTNKSNLNKEDYSMQYGSCSLQQNNDYTKQEKYSKTCVELDVHKHTNFQPLDLRKISNTQQNMTASSRVQASDDHLSTLTNSSSSYTRNMPVTGPANSNDELSLPNQGNQGVPEIVQMQLLADLHLRRFERPEKKVTHNSKKFFIAGNIKEGFKVAVVGSTEYGPSVENSEGNKPYSCEICGKLYRQVRDYRAHLATHANGKVYRCDICSKTLENTSDYINHLQEHQQRGLHSCPYCKKYFRDKCTLDTHLRIHTGEKPYQCKICDKRFRQSGTFQRHKKLHS